MGCDWQPGDPNFYQAYSWYDDRWWVGQGGPSWTGPFNIVSAKREEITKLHWHRMIDGKSYQRLGKASIKHVGGGQYKLKFQFLE